jgi:hypothetical protein
MSYCTVDDVCTAFPRFVRNSSGSIQDSDIQDWLNNWKARIRGAFQSRQIDPDTLRLNADQAAFLRALNLEAGMAELGSALEGNVTLQPGEYSLPASRRRSCERQIEEIKKGLYDAMFSQLARHVEIEPLFGGTAGGETDRETAQDRGENKAFSKNQNF